MLRVCFTCKGILYNVTVCECACVAERCRYIWGRVKHIRPKRNKTEIFYYGSQKEKQTVLLVQQQKQQARSPKYTVECKDFLEAKCRRYIQGWREWRLRNSYADTSMVKVMRVSGMESMVVQSYFRGRKIMAAAVGCCATACH